MSSFNWLRPTFEKLDNVVSVTVDGPVFVLVRKDDPPMLIGFAGESDLDEDVVNDLVSSHDGLDFIVNVPKDGRILGSAIERAANLGIAVGGVGDAMRAARLTKPGQYIHPQLNFVIRGLRQHSRVTYVRRLDDRKLSVDRTNLTTITAYICPDYQPTAEAVRVAIDRYGPFDVFVAIDPNSDPSLQAIEAAKSAGVQVYRWGAFLSALNRP